MKVSDVIISELFERSRVMIWRSGAPLIDEVRRAHTTQSTLYIPVAFADSGKEGMCMMPLSDVHDLVESEMGYTFAGICAQFVPTLVMDGNADGEVGYRLFVYRSTCQVAVTGQTLTLTMNTTINFTDVTGMFDFEAAAKSHFGR